MYLLQNGSVHYTGQDAQNVLAQLQSNYGGAIQSSNGDSANTSGNSSSNINESEEEEYCGGADNMVRTIMAEKLADKGVGNHLIENYKEL